MNSKSSRSSWTDEQRDIVRRDARRELAERSDEDFCRFHIKIVDKNKKMVPFIWNSIQKRIDAKVEEQWALGKPAFIIILKARQPGVSTWAQGKIICRMRKKPNTNALTVAHRDDSTKKIFNKAKYMYRHMPDGIKPMLKASNAYELIFDNPTGYQGSAEGLNSQETIQTAGGTGIGISDTYDAVHLSEYAKYPGNPENAYAEVMQAVPNVPGVLVVIESTANGYNHFKKLWDAAMAGENEWTAMFFAWHEHEEYTMPCAEGEAERVMASLSEYEQKIQGLYSLTPGQIKWYRWTLANKCDSNAAKMREENPSYPEEAFIFTGTPVFDNEKVQLRIEFLRKKYADPAKAPKVGRFTFDWKDKGQKLIDPDSIKFVEDKNGWVTVYQEPQRGHPYVAGGDTKGEGHDFYTCTVKDNSNGQRVVALKMQLKTSKPYTRQMFCLGYWYNKALIGIEMNFNTAPVEDLEEWNYPNQYIREKSADTMGDMLEKKLGWKTDGDTRPRIIDREVDIVENHLELFNDIGTLEEMLTFAYDEDKRPDAMEGEHDDLLFSDMIAEEIGKSGQQKTSIAEERKEPHYNFDSEKPQPNPYTGGEIDRSYIDYGG